MANEFEKNARKLLDEFKLHPSEQVWQNVEDRIREKKRKRRIIFFILFSCTVLTLGGYGIYEVQGTRSEARGTRTNDQLKALTKTTKSKNSDSLHSSSANITNTIQNRETGKDKTTDEATGEKKQPQKKAIAFRNNSNALKREDHIQTVSSKEKAVNEKQRLTNATSSQTKPGNSSDNKQRVSIDTPDHAVTVAPEKKDTATAKLVDSATIKQQKAGQAVNENSPQKNNQSTKKIEWGLNFSAGASTITQDHLSNANTNSYGGNLSSLPGAYTGGGSTYGQSVNNPSFAFMLGVVVRKKVSNRSSLSAGVQYNYLADKISVGQKHDNVPASQSTYALSYSSYYTGNPIQTYSDHFHFIDMPLMYDWRITNNAKHFLSLNVGISASFLVSTNALVYDTTAGGIYHHDKNSFAHSIINFIPGLSYHFTAKKLEWSVGPQAYFDLSKFIKSDLDQRKYLFYLGLNAKLFFVKKK